MSTHRENERRDRGGWRRDQMLRPEAFGRFTPSRELHRMQWRAAGAQFYPGGAYEQLLERSHRGRGPKGYQRSDELLKEIICEILTDDSLIDARNIEVEVASCEVTLRGAVEERQQKYAIEDRIADVAGVTEIHNYLSVSNRDGL
jgi:hypothetical protein